MINTCNYIIIYNILCGVYITYYNIEHHRLRVQLLFLCTCNLHQPVVLLHFISLINALDIRGLYNKAYIICVSCIAKCTPLLTFSAFPCPPLHLHFIQATSQSPTPRVHTHFVIKVAGNFVQCMCMKFGIASQWQTRTLILFNVAMDHNNSPL